jgi:alkylation response protein AidB-like acyl-CoA dehydrogenase
MTNQTSPAGGAFLLASVLPNEFFIPEDFSAESRAIGCAAEAFLRADVLPHVERIESGDHALMRDLMQRAGSLGLLGADVPTIYGGSGLDVPTAALIAEKLNPQQSFALTHEAHTVIATLPLLYFGSHAQKQKYLPKLATGEWIGSFALSEANSGSDALGMQTHAELSPNGSAYILNGVKSWITNTGFADLFTVFARVENKITALLVERDFPGVSFGHEEQKLGMRGTSTRRVILDDARVPTENVLPIGTGHYAVLPIGTGHYAAFCALNMGRFKLEAGAVGGLKEVLRICAVYTLQRKTFGKPIAAYGMVQHKLAEMAARTFALESMVYRLAGDLESVFRGVVPDAPEAAREYHRAAEEYAIECNIVKVIGSEAYSELTDEAIQIHGGYGYTEQFPVARAWRDQRLLRIGEGANEIVRVAIANLLLRRNAAGRLPVLTAELPGNGNADSLMAQAANAKRLALLLLRAGVEKFGADGLLEAQEVAATVADAACAAYAIESATARVQRLAGDNSPHAETAALAARVATLGHAATAARAGRYALACLEGVEHGEMRQLIDALENGGEKPMTLRRELARVVLEARGYPL